MALRDARSCVSLLEGELRTESGQDVKLVNFARSDGVLIGGSEAHA